MAIRVEQTTSPRVASVPRGADLGLSEAEAARRLAQKRTPKMQRSSRSYASIVRANVVTVFNLILAALG